MNNYQKLTRVAFIVVTMAVMFGLHITFPVETAEADHYNKFCEVKLHRVYGTGITSDYGVDSGRSDRVYTNCADCSFAGLSPKWHTRKILYDKETIKKWYEHKYLIGLSWSNCHVHTIINITIYKRVVSCSVNA